MSSLFTTADFSKKILTRRLLNPSKKFLPLRVKTQLSCLKTFLNKINVLYVEWSRYLLNHLYLGKVFYRLRRWVPLCRIPIRHFFSQSRRLLTKIFKSAETVNEKFRCLWIRGQGAIKLGYYARYLFPLPPFHKTRDTPSRVKQGGSRKSFGTSSWHLLRQDEKLQRKKDREKEFQG